MPQFRKIEKRTDQEYRSDCVDDAKRALDDAISLLRTVACSLEGSGFLELSKKYDEACTALESQRTWLDNAPR